MVHDVNQQTLVTLVVLGDVPSVGHILVEVERLLLAPLEEVEEVAASLDVVDARDDLAPLIFVVHLALVHLDEVLATEDGDQLGSGSRQLHAPVLVEEVLHLLRVELGADEGAHHISDVIFILNQVDVVHGRQLFHLKCGT